MVAAAVGAATMRRSSGSSGEPCARAARARDGGRAAAPEASPGGLVSTMGSAAD